MFDEGMGLEGEMALLLHIWRGQKQNFAKRYIVHVGVWFRELGKRGTAYALYRAAPNRFLAPEQSPFPIGELFYRPVCVEKKVATNTPATPQSTVHHRPIHPPQSFPNTSHPHSPHQSTLDSATTLSANPIPYIKPTQPPYLKPPFQSSLEIPLRSRPRSTLSANTLNQILLLSIIRPPGAGMMIPATTMASRPARIARFSSSAIIFLTLTR